MTKPGKIFSDLLHVLTRAFVTLLLRIFYNIKVTGEENIPDKEGVMFMSNHASFFDPPLVSTMSWKRQLNFMARDTLFKNPFFGGYIRAVGAIPIKRGAVDRKSWGALTDRISEGGAVVFFPEGTRTPDGEIKDGKPGTGMLVHASRAKVVPVYIKGAFEAWPKGGGLPKLFKKMEVHYGKMMSFDDCLGKEGSREIYEEITNAIVNEIRRIKAEKEQTDKK
jgi:1-acyl-sn-glycerol-3-phosphate acyltransferase